MASKFLDYDGLLYFWNRLKTKFVSKETGKGLSTNDYTTAEKNKLAGIDASADVNKIETVKVYGTALTPDSNKAVNVAPYPTDIPFEYRGHNVEEYWPDSNNVGSMLDETWDAVIDAKEYADSFAAQIPKKTSQLTNDSNFVVDASYVHSDNNFTAAEKNKLAGIATGAEANVQADWNVNTSSSDAFIKHKPAVPTFAETTSSGIGSVDISLNVVLPDEGGTYCEEHIVPTTTGIKAYVDNAVGSITGVQFEVVTELPATGSTGTIYLVSHSHGTRDIYDEYIWLSSTSTYEKIGSTDIDLSGYMLKTDMVAITNSEIDTVVAA